MPLTVSRHPVVVLVLLGIVLLVRGLCLPELSLKWGWVARVAVSLASIGVIFNALTVRSGNQVAFQVPVLNWDITWNAIAYGVVSGIAMIALVLTGTTLAAGLDWIALSRVLPRRFAPLAAAGSVAWSFLPGASQAIAEIREAQIARGHRIRSVRDVLPIVVPLLDTSLGRALSMSEALEVRGFGASAGESKLRSSATHLWMALLLGGALLIAYAVSMSSGILLWISIAIAAVGLIGMLREPSASGRTSRYREQRLDRTDRIVIAASVLSLVSFVALYIVSPGGVAFNPYPDLKIVAPDYRFVISAALLLTPAVFAQGESTI